MMADVEEIPAGTAVFFPFHHHKFSFLSSSASCLLALSNLAIAAVLKQPLILVWCVVQFLQETTHNLYTRSKYKRSWCSYHRNCQNCPYLSYNHACSYSNCSNSLFMADLYSRLPFLEHLRPSPSLPFPPFLSEGYVMRIFMWISAVIVAQSSHEEWRNGSYLWWSSWLEGSSWGSFWSQRDIGILLHPQGVARSWINALGARTWFGSKYGRPTQTTALLPLQAGLLHRIYLHKQLNTSLVLQSSTLIFRILICL